MQINTNLVLFAITVLGALSGVFLFIINKLLKNKEDEIVNKLKVGRLEEKVKELEDCLKSHAIHIDRLDRDVNGPNID